VVKENNRWLAGGAGIGARQLSGGLKRGGKEGARTWSTMQEAEAVCVRPTKRKKKKGRGHPRGPPNFTKVGGRGREKFKGRGGKDRKEREGC